MIKIIPNKESVYSEEISLNNRIYNNSVNFINSLCTEDENWISHPSHCLISITPIKFKEKLSLFGGKIRVMTSNKITIYKAMISKNDRSIYEKGSMLFEFYISDESLMDAVIGSNSNPSPCTISNILSNAQNYQSGNKQETSVEKALSDIKGDMQEVSNFTSEFKSFIDDVISKGRVLKKDRDSFVTSLKAAIGNLPSNCAYVIKTLEKNLEKDLNSFEIEILSTLKKISSIKNEEDFLMIENNLKDNYLQWVIDGEFSIDESKSLLKLYKSIRSTGSEETIKKVDHMISLFQKIINGKRMPLNKTDGAMEIHRISGGIKCFGQENNDNDYFEISFGQGVQSSDSSYYLSMVNKFLNLNITKTNLMSLIRGEEGKLIPVTLSSIARKQIPFVKLYSSKINDDVRTLEKSLNKKVEVLKDLASDLIAILDLKLNKAEKKSLDDKFKEFNNVLIEIKQMCLDDSMAEIEKVELNFKDKLMSSISKSINIENANSKKIIVELLSK